MFHTERPRGFGHIDFSSAEDAQRAIEQLSGVAVMGRDLRIDHARRKEEVAAAGGSLYTPPAARRSYSSDSRSSGGGGYAGGAGAVTRSMQQQQHSVFLGILAWEVNEQTVREMIDDVVGAGLYTGVRMAIDRDTGRPKGYAHVDFKDAASANRAVQELNGLQVLGRPLRVDNALRKPSSFSPAAGGADANGGGGGGGYSSYSESSSENLSDDIESFGSS